MIGLPLIHEAAAAPLDKVSCKDDGGLIPSGGNKMTTQG